MIDFFQVYNYLACTLLLLLLFSIGLTISPQQLRKTAIWSAILSVPTSVTSILFVPDYWDPRRIIGQVIGMEDMIFSFTTGGIAWLTAVWSLRHRINWIFHGKKISIRFAKLVLGGSIVNLVFLFLGVGIMNSVVIAIMAVGAWVLFKRKDYWIIGVNGVISFSAFYFGFVSIAFALFPEFLDQWNAEMLFGLYVGKVPFEEILWAFACGCAWPLIIAFLLDVTLKPKPDVIMDI